MSLDEARRGAAKAHRHVRSVFAKMTLSEQYAPRRSLAATWVLRSGADADDERLDVFFRMHTKSHSDLRSPLTAL